MGTTQTMLVFKRPVEWNEGKVAGPFNKGSIHL